VNRIRWTVLICLLGVVLCSALPALDVSDSTLNEADQPIAILHPALVRVRVAPPVILAAAAAKASQELFLRACVARPAFRNEVRPGKVRHLQQLLCVFLI